MNRFLSFAFLFSLVSLDLHADDGKLQKNWTRPDQMLVVALETEAPKTAKIVFGSSGSSSFVGFGTIDLRSNEGLFLYRILRDDYYHNTPVVLETDGAGEIVSVKERLSR